MKAIGFALNQPVKESKPAFMGKWSNRTLLFVFLGANLLDAIITVVLISNTMGYELNPLLKAVAGSPWFIPFKVCAAFFLWWAVRRFLKANRRVLVAAVVGACLVVLINVGMIAYALVGV